MNLNLSRRENILIRLISLLPSTCAINKLIPLKDNFSKFSVVHFRKLGYFIYSLWDLKMRSIFSDDY